MGRMEAPRLKSINSREKITISVLPLGEYIGQQTWITADDTMTIKDDGRNHQLLQSLER